MEKNRPLTIFKYLWDHTDEDHPAIITEILAYLEASGFHATRKTVAADLLQLQESGFDVVCTKSRQNRYFIGTRTLEIAELKAIVDAVQAAKFLSADKSTQLIEKLAALGSPYQAEQLKRNLYVSGKAKTHNEAVYYTVDLLHTAINNNFPVTFQYLQYTPDKQCIEKHKRRTVYSFPIRHGLGYGPILRRRLVGAARKNCQVPGRPHRSPSASTYHLSSEAGRLFR